MHLLLQQPDRSPPPSQPTQQPAASTPRSTAKPSDQAISKLFGKIDGDLDQALRAGTLDWCWKRLDDEDAKVVAYVIASSAVLKELE